MAMKVAGAVHSRSIHVASKNIWVCVYIITFAILFSLGDAKQCYDCSAQKNLFPPQCIQQGDDFTTYCGNDDAAPQGCESGQFRQIEVKLLPPSPSDFGYSQKTKSCGVATPPNCVDFMNIQNRFHIEVNNMPLLNTTGERDIYTRVNGSICYCQTLPCSNSSTSITSTSTPIKMQTSILKFGAATPTRNYANKTWPVLGFTMFISIITLTLNVIV